MARSPKNWLHAACAAKNTVRQQARLVLETLERREVLSATTPSYALSNGNLYQGLAGVRTLIDRNVESYQANGHGQVAVLEKTGDLKYFAKRTLTAIDSGVTAYHLDSTGALVELDSQGNFERYTPSSGTVLVDVGVGSFAVTSTGRIYLFQTNGTFLGSNDGLPGDFTQIDTEVQSFSVASTGRVYLLQNDGSLLGSNDGLPGDFSPIDFSVQSFDLASTGRLYLLQSDGSFLSSVDGQSGDLTVIDTNVQAIALGSKGPIYELENTGLLLSSSTGLPGSFTTAGVNVTSISVSNGTVVINDWFSQNLDDGGVAAVARKDFALHDELTYTDMLGLFRQADSGTTVSAEQLQSLRAVVANASMLNLSDAVVNLASKTVNGDPADAHYEGHRLAPLTAGGSARVLRALVNKWFLGLDRPAAGGAYSAVGGSLFSKVGPSYKDVCQGYVGDCWLIVGFAETAARMPSVISSMFIANGNNTWTVRFYINGVADYVTVDNQLPDGGTYYDDVTGHPLWVALAEKACAQENASGQLQTSVPGANGYYALDGGDPAVSLSAITGQNANDLDVDPTSVGAAWQQGQLVVLATPFYPANPYIVPDHAYAVVGYNETTGAVTLFNPWGVSGGYSNSYYYPGYVTVNSKNLARSFNQTTTCSTEASGIAGAPAGGSMAGSPVAGGVDGLVTDPAGGLGPSDDGRRAFGGGALVASGIESIDAVFRALSAKQGQGRHSVGEMPTSERGTPDHGLADGEWHQGQGRS
jgi:hypothetical protein